MKLIVISGSGAAGKTTVGKKVANLLDYDFISKDTIKEQLFDSEARTTHDFYWYETKAKNKFFTAIEQNIAQDNSIVIENDFINKDKKRLKSCLSKKVIAIEVYCSAKGFTRLKRFVMRNESKSRHKGHHDRRWYIPMFIGAILSYIGINWPNGPVNISSRRLDVDTTELSRINYKDIVEFARQA